PLIYYCRPVPVLLPDPSSTVPEDGLPCGRGTLPARSERDPPCDAETSGCIVSEFCGLGEVAHPVPKLIQAVAKTIPEIMWLMRFINLSFFTLKLFLPLKDL